MKRQCLQGLCELLSARNCFPNTFPTVLFYPRLKNQFLGVENIKQRRKPIFEGKKGNVRVPVYKRAQPGHHNRVYLGSQFRNQRAALAALAVLSGFPCRFPLAANEKAVSRNFDDGRQLEEIPVLYTAHLGFNL